MSDEGYESVTQRREVIYAIERDMKRMENLRDEAAQAATLAVGLGIAACAVVGVFITLWVNAPRWVFWLSAFFVPIWPGVYFGTRWYARRNLKLLKAKMLMVRE